MDPEAYRSYRMLRTMLASDTTSDADVEAMALSIPFNSRRQQSEGIRVVETPSLPPDEGGVGDNSDFDVRDKKGLETYLVYKLKEASRNSYSDAMFYLRSGFHGGMYTRVLRSLTFTPEELECAVVRGGWGALERDRLVDAVIDSWKTFRLRTENKSRHGVTVEKIATITEWWWELVDSASREERARVVRFVTGATVPPHPRHVDQNVSKFSIEVANDPDLLPRASTCFNMLCLGNYNSKEAFGTKLRQAIEWGERAMDDRVI